MAFTPDKQKRLKMRKKFAYREGPKTKSNYFQAKIKAMRAWEISYFEAILNYYAGRSHRFIARAIGIDRANLLRKLRAYKLGAYAPKPEAVTT